jgi:hypothetical protein
MYSSLGSIFSDLYFFQPSHLKATCEVEALYYVRTTFSCYNTQWRMMVTASGIQ